MVVRSSNILTIEPKPFDPDSFDEDDSYLDEKGTKRVRLDDNIARWREVVDADGNVKVRLGPKATADAGEICISILLHRSSSGVFEPRCSLQSGQLLKVWLVQKVLLMPTLGDALFIGSCGSSVPAYVRCFWLQRESNARFVKWSDGTWQLMIGTEVLNVQRQSMAGDQTQLFVRHPRVWPCRCFFTRCLHGCRSRLESSLRICLTLRLAYLYCCGPSFSKQVLGGRTGDLK